MAEYIGRAMLRFTPNEKNYGMAVHHVMDHYICFQIYPTWVRDVVIDSADYPKEAYTEFITILQKRTSSTYTS
ncbi:hypothetical protein ACP70R_012346 [Stipagrostis hirtigluma subsp. patula]